MNRISGYLLSSLLLSMVAAALGGCSNDDLGSYIRLGDLRVLALSADLPEAAPATVVTVTPHLSDLNGAGRALTFTAESCLDPGVGYGAAPTCAGSASRVVIAQNAAVVGLAAPEYTGAVTNFAVTTPAAATIFAGRSAVDQANGVAYLVTYQVTAADGTTLKSFRRIIVSTRAAKNANPSLTSVLNGGAAFGTYPTAAVTLTPVITAASFESYTTLFSAGGGETRQETLTTTWFITDGEMRAYRTSAAEPNVYTPLAVHPSGRDAVFVFVTHDNRGGVSVLRLGL